MWGGGSQYSFHREGIPHRDRLEVRWRVKPGLKCHATLHGCTHLIINLQNGFFGSITSVLLFILPFDDGEGLHNVLTASLGWGKASRVRAPLFMPFFIDPR